MKYSFQRKSKGSPLIEYEILGNNDTKLAYNQSMDIKVDIKYSQHNICGIPFQIRNYPRTVSNHCLTRTKLTRSSGKDYGEISQFHTANNDRIVGVNAGRKFLFTSTYLCLARWTQVTSFVKLNVFYSHIMLF